MHETTLDGEAWRQLLFTVFQPAADERRLALLVDLPDPRRDDNPAWQDRRRLAAEWRESMAAALDADGFTVELWLYRNAHTNNGDLPPEAWSWPAGSPALPDHVDQLASTASTPFANLFDSCPLFIALCELSATAPLKHLARRHGFKAATMPRFSRPMMPALGLDFAEVDRRCQLLKQLLDAAVRADFQFTAGNRDHRLALDLRHRLAHASSGLLHEAGSAGNLPSGETYIVPYEGEIDGQVSRSEGSLPVELDGELVVYQVEGNRARTALGEGPTAARERQLLRDEPAYANIAELGLGVLGEMGIEPLGEILLDEKLGLHIAFGRSDHFGGSVGPADFSSPDAVVHIDRVFLPRPESLVKVRQVRLTHTDGRHLCLMRNGRYQLDFEADAEAIWR